MNLKNMTISKLEYHKNELIDLQECLESGKLTKDCEHFTRERIAKEKEYIKYFESILKILEDNEWNAKL